MNYTRGEQGYYTKDSREFQLLFLVKFRRFS